MLLLICSTEHVPVSFSLSGMLSLRVCPIFKRCLTKSNSAGLTTGSSFLVRRKVGLAHVDVVCAES